MKICQRMSNQMSHRIDNPAVACATFFQLSQLVVILLQLQNLTLRGLSTGHKRPQRIILLLYATDPVDSVFIIFKIRNEIFARGFNEDISMPGNKKTIISYESCY